MIEALPHGTRGTNAVRTLHFGCCRGGAEVDFEVFSKILRYKLRMTARVEWRIEYVLESG